MSSPGEAEEWFDVVDEVDRVVSRAPRGEVHRRRWRHRAVHVLVFNRHGELFLQQRSLAKDDFPGAWDSSSAGHVSSGDDYAPTALREVAEELGVALEIPPVELFRLDACEQTAWEFCRVYLARHEGPFVLQASEVRGGGWFSAPAVDDWIARRPGDFSSAFRSIWGRFDRRLIPRLPASVSGP
jgi:16S rRNA (adenine1518-N6/adenine1519-N6)-dimethyltransferase